MATYANNMLQSNTTCTCDGCEELIDNVKHLSLNFWHLYSGIALPPTKKTPKWTVKDVLGLTGTLVHFHNGDCAKKFFDRAMKAK